LSFDFGIEFGWAAEIGDLYVMPAARGRGLARALVEACEGLARGQGATNLQVTLTGHGETAGLRAFYARLGFADDGRRILWRAISADPAVVSQFEFLGGAASQRRKQAKAKAPAKKPATLPS
jgi:predicted N-acetyltransferase YhbS